ncbi:hypothetical protein FQA39_LY18041 [Lamprigera yunnana]|nr:hypothetical protein FQA39_LY18041 [Lamprigera yunnana]
MCALHFLEKHFVNVNKNRLIHDAVPVNFKSGQLLHENRQNSGIAVMKSPEKLTLRKNGCRKCYRNSNPDSNLSAHFFVEDTSQSPDRLTTSENTQNIENPYYDSPLQLYFQKPEFTEEYQE